MPTAKKSAPAKTASKAAPAKAPAKAPAAPAKPSPTSGKAPARSALPAKPSAPAKGAPAGEGEAPPVVPKAGLQKTPGRDTLCQIEIVKDGHFFIARTQTEGAADKEYKNTVFEDLLTEMVITLQEQLVDK
ncbi:MAG: hypothetical protein QOG31_1065 [Thermoplasmata archaeon]|jgi:hypothetical protein|nr:hypothetical protein [Thermoplasmata archaeon]